MGLECGPSGAGIITKWGWKYSQVGLELQPSGAWSFRGGAVVGLRVGLARAGVRLAFEWGRWGRPKGRGPSAAGVVQFVCMGPDIAGYPGPVKT